MKLFGKCDTFSGNGVFFDEANYVGIRQRTLINKILGNHEMKKAKPLLNSVSLSNEIYSQ